MTKPELRRGGAAIEQAAESKGGGDFRPFVPRIEWRDDGEKKFILLLTPMDEVPTVSLHEWIPVGTGEKANGETYTRYETFVSRKDPGIGEDYDRLGDELDSVPKERSIGVAVELEPVFETVKGRQKAKGFSVKTGEFTRNTDDGEEEVTFPYVGMITQSVVNYWGALVSLDASQGPLADLPVEIVRRGKDANTRYDFIPYVDVPVDFSSLIENIGGISYLGEDLDDLLTELEASTDDMEAAQAIANMLLDKRLDELMDGERYDELTGEIEEIEQKFGGKKKKDAKRSPRPARASQRKASSNGDGEAETATEKPASGGSDRSERFKALRAQVEK